MVVHLTTGPKYEMGLPYLLPRKDITTKRRDEQTAPNPGFAEPTS